MKLKAIALMCLVMVVTACGSQRDSTARTAISSLQSALSKKSAPLTTATIRARLTPEVLAQFNSPVMIAELPKVSVASVIVLTEQSLGYDTWFTPDGVSVVTRQGLVTATRGVGYDLMSADVSDTLNALKGPLKPSRGTRVHEYLDGEDQIVSLTFDCTYFKKRARGGYWVSESCVSGKTQIENQYWLNTSHGIVQSVQWIGARNGYMLIEGPILP